MTRLTRAACAQWLESYGRASAQDDPQTSANLFSVDARYYESPCDLPPTGRQAIYGYWAGGAERFTDKSSSFEVLAVRDNLGIARWQSRFVVKAMAVVSRSAIRSCDCRAAYPVLLAQAGLAGRWCYIGWHAPGCRAGRRGLAGPCHDPHEL